MEKRWLSLALRLVACLSLVSIAWSCDKYKGVEVPDIGCYYNVVANGEHYVFFIDEIKGYTGTGHYYSAGDGVISDRHQFEATISKKYITITSDGKSENIGTGNVYWEKYVVPEFFTKEAGMLLEPKYSVRVDENVKYATAEGYWSSLQGVEADAIKAFTDGYLKSFKKRKLDLEMDVYQPVGAPGNRPFIMFIHGGAFYVGNKEEPAYIDFCKYFASLGYVTASINYRLGFHMGKGAIERAAYMALQDGHAAMRYIVCNASQYGIDTRELFLAGSSAGSITALNMAFMEDQNRPKSSHGRKGIFHIRDLGPVDASGNDYVAQFHIRALANMWGAVSTLEMLENSNTDIISFAGDQDQVVPFDRGYPFEMAGKAVASTLSDPMFGSVSIDRQAKRLGLRSELHLFEGEGHALNTTGKDKQPNQNHEFIKENMKRFFFESLVPEVAELTYDGDGIYAVHCPDVREVMWKVEGGFIIDEGVNEITVLWQSDKPVHKIYASGEYYNGIGFNFEKEY